MAIDPNNLQGTAHVTFDDEFNSLSLWSPSNPSGVWATTFWYQDPNGNGSTLAGNGEQEWYINSNYGPTASVTPWTDSNGVLTLTAAPASSAVSSLINGYGYTSGEVNSYHSFSQTYGYFEMRAQLPAGQGFWPAFWLMPESGAWPPELDIMEVLGNNTSVLYNTVHTLETGSHTMVGDGGVTVADMSTGYHTYGVDWESDYITFYFDGKAVYQTATPSDMHQPMYMIANLAAGGYWPGNVTPGSTGQMNIDYIRAYADGAAAGVASTSSSAPATTSTAVSAPTAQSTAPAQASPGTTGQTFTSDNNGDHWTGTAGADVFNLGRGGDVVTGNGGADTFKFAQVPWGHAEITDFNSGDVLDLSAMLASVGYAGSNPLSDGHLQFVSDGAGGTQVWLNTSGLPVSIGSWEIAALDHVAPSSLSIANGLITEGAAAASSSGGSASTTSTAASTSTSTASSASGQTFTSDNNGDHWTGTAGADVFNLGRGGDVVTGNGGADTFRFAQVPWGHAEIADFNSGDMLDLSAMLASVGYAGSNPLSDGHLQFVSDGAGGTQVWLNTSGLPVNIGSWEIAALDHVAPSSLSIANGLITEAGSSGAASASTSTTSSSASTGVAGQIFTSDNNGDHWTGTAGADTFILGRGGDVVTGNGGADTFVFHETPWSGAEITDFHSGDTMDLSGLLAIDGYASGDPTAEGYLKVAADAAGDAQIWSHLSGQWWLTATLDHVAPSSLHVSGAFITG